MDYDTDLFSYVHFGSVGEACLTVDHHLGSRLHAGNQLVKRSPEALTQFHFVVFYCAVFLVDIHIKWFPEPCCFTTALSGTTTWSYFAEIEVDTAEHAGKDFASGVGGEISTPNVRVAASTVGMMSDTFPGMSRRHRCRK